MSLLRTPTRDLSLIILFPAVNYSGEDIQLAAEMNLLFHSRLCPLSPNDDEAATLYALRCGGHSESFNTPSLTL